MKRADKVMGSSIQGTASRRKNIVSSAGGTAQNHGLRYTRTFESAFAKDTRTRTSTVITSYTIQKKSKMGKDAGVIACCQYD